jgi:hypothetical protein
MVNNKKINNYYRKKNSPQRNKSSNKDVDELATATTIHPVSPPNESRLHTEEMDTSDFLMDFLAVRLKAWMELENGFGNHDLR